jgi:hypothetical protein
MMIVRHGYEVSMVKNICEELATTEQTCSKNPKSHLCNDELKKSIDSSYKKVINLKQKFLQN